MTRTRKIAWGVMWGAALLFCLSIALFSEKQGSTARVTTVVSGQDLKPESAADLVEENAGTAALEWGRDPFVLEERALSSGENRLTGIVFDENQQEQSYAIIDGQLVKAGDEINGWKVLKIGKNSVDIENDGRKEELFLNQ